MDLRSCDISIHILNKHKHSERITWNQLLVRAKERGRGETKRHWAIELNESRQLYLGSDGRVDTINALIKHCNLYYCSWKYWHASKLHVQALTTSTRRLFLRHLRSLVLKRRRKQGSVSWNSMNSVTSFQNKVYN
jgi:hypothetical protein